MNFPSLDDIAVAGDKAVLLCATHRLAWNLRLAHGRAQRQAGLKQWQPLQVLTLNQWLEDVTQRALLSGKVSPQEIPRRGQ